MVFGIVLLTSTEDLISIASKVIGIILIVVGIVKSIVYIYMIGKLGNYTFTKFVSPIIKVLAFSNDFTSRIISAHE